MKVIDTPIFLLPSGEVFFQGFGGVTNQPLQESFTGNSPAVTNEKTAMKKNLQLQLFSKSKIWPKIFYNHKLMRLMRSAR